jgi:hypothetical protein
MPFAAVHESGSGTSRTSPADCVRSAKCSKADLGCHYRSISIWRRRRQQFVDESIDLCSYPSGLQARSKGAAQSPHRGRGIELLGDRDEGHAMAIEQFDQFGEVRQRAAQSDWDQIDKPSIAYCRDHSAGASRGRVTPNAENRRDDSFWQRQLRQRLHERESPV